MIFLLMTWEDIFLTVLLNLVCGIIVSLVFLWFLLRWLRPQIKISDQICCTTESVKNEQGQEIEIPKYTFKVVNCSIFHAFDVKIELYALRPIPLVGANSNLKLIKLKLRTSDRTHITRFRKKHHQKDPFALFAFLLHTNDDLDKYLAENETYIELRITLRHGLTGLADTFTQQFSTQDVIKKGYKFNFGAKFDAIPKNRAI